MKKIIPLTLAAFVLSSCARNDSIDVGAYELAVSGDFLDLTGSRGQEYLTLNKYQQKVVVGNGTTHPSAISHDRISMSHDPLQGGLTLTFDGEENLFFSGLSNADAKLIVNFFYSQKSSILEM